MTIAREDRRHPSAAAGFSQDDDLIQAFLFDRPNEEFSVRVAVGPETVSERREGLAEPGTLFRVRVADEDPVATEDGVIHGCEHPGDLARPGVTGIRTLSISTRI